MTSTLLLGFTGLCVLLAITPGPDTFLVLRYSLRGNRAGLAAAVGSSLGSLVWAGAVAVGVAALLEQSATSYRVVKIAGGLYLLYLGVSALVKRHNAAVARGEDEQVPPVRLRSALRAGLLSCTLNPKVGLFFLAVVPQFVSDRGSPFAATMMLGLIDFAVSLVYLVCLALASAHAVAWLRRPRVTRVLDRVSAGVLTAFGLGTLASAK